MKKLLATTLLFALPCWADTVKININSHQDGPVINRNIYGQFAEHLGRGIYDGVYVGKDSKIPNTDGFRNDVVAALKELKIPLVRWPGGCFADEYHWRDGIGPMAERPARLNTSWGGVAENNAVGTHEFFRFIELIGAEAYIAGNLGSGSVKEMADWMEYITSDSQSNLATERRKNGREQPWEVAFWGVGNESWGCGGNMRPEFYADLYRQYATFLRAPGHRKPKLVASGGNAEQTIWTETLSKNVKENINGISHHYYTLPTNDWSKKGQAFGFPEAEWITTFIHTRRMETYLQDNIRVLDKNDPEGKLGFYVDEWGTWYDPEPNKDDGILYQQNTLRDAMVAAINLNIFHKYARRVQMANIAQLVNVLQAMILTEKEKMLLTPTYHTFKMYKVFQDATALNFESSTIPNYKLGDLKTEALSISTARGTDGKIYLAIANIDTQRSHQLKLLVDGKKVSSIQGYQLTGEAIDTKNTFSRPNNITPKEINAKAKRDGSFELPAKAIMVVALEL